MSNAQTRNTKKVEKLNRAIEAAIINRVADALDNNHIKAVCNEIAYDPKILSACVICRGQYLTIGEHLKYTISILPESKLSAMKEKIDTFSDRHLKRIFSGLFPKPIEPQEDEVSIISDTNTNRFLPELFFKPAGTKSMHFDYKSEVVSMIVRVTSAKPLIPLFAPSITSKVVIEYEEDIDIECCDDINPYKEDSALGRSPSESSYIAPSGQVAKFNAVEFNGVEFL